MSRGLYYVLDEAGEPRACDDPVAWGRWFEAATKSGARFLAETPVGPGRVSTVFLGLDHSFTDEDEAPTLWETMIFDVPGHDGDCWPHRSRADAEEGHRHAIAVAEHALEVLP